MDGIGDLILDRFNYWIYVVLMMIGLYAMITKRNLIKKLIGMSIFQTAIILFFVSVGVKEGATIPILSHESEEVGSAGHFTEADANQKDLDSDTITNPLPHVLMLTAIVVGVSTLGVGLAVTQKIFIQFQSLEEDSILERIRSGDG
jgi:multicomponent Na+:H+ antiporter subunit C